MWTSTYYNFWDYWELRHKVTFDGPNKLILVNEGETSLDIQTEVYSDWKEWVLLEDNLKYFPPLNTVGGEPTIGAERLDVTYFLINGWRIKPYPGSYNLNLVGNIFDVDGGNIQVPADINPLFPNNITVNINTSVIVRQLTTTGSGGGGTLDPDSIVSASLFGAQETALYNIENRVIAIQSALTTGAITSSLDASQSLQLTSIENYSISASSQLTTNTDYLISQSQEIQTLNSLNVSQSAQLTTLLGTNVSQSAQLTSLVETNGSQSIQLTTLESQLNSVLAILAQQGVSGSLLEDRVTEVWQIHGLDSSNPLLVTRTARTAGSISQTINTVGTGSAQQTTITRP
jgi:hypothetical protein